MTIEASTDKRASFKQVAYIARLSVDLLGEEFPESRSDASALIERMKTALEERATNDQRQEVPF